MENTVLHVKNMVCNRCIRVVKEEMEELGFEIESIELGNIVIKGGVTDDGLMAIEKALLSNGFELINDRQHQIIEQVKKIIIEHVRYNNSKPGHINFSEYLERQIGVNYTSISKLFSSFEGVTIEKYLILQKTERVKELLAYGEQTLSEIAYELVYSSVAHLSGQFKKVTGMTPTEFKNMAGSRRKPLDEV